MAGERQEASGGALLAELGSLTLEFTRLSQLSGEPKFFDAVQRISEMLKQQQYKTKLPGLWPVMVNAKNKSCTRDDGFTLGAMADSAYEYLPKVCFPQLWPNCVFVILVRTD
jgi:mannosyl-oligosaccharide alpha-1,2-mannosidase